MQDAPHQWESWRRPLDYYEEDELNWLWVDTIIRQQTHGQKSMDDFCRLFHGAPSGPPQVKTYTFEDVVSTLNQVVPYDWRGFWIERLGNHGPGAPLGGIEGSGWKLVYDDAQSELVRAREDDREMVNAAYSIGLWLKPDGTIVDTVEGMPAAQAGIGPGMKVVAVNGRKFSPQHSARRVARREEKLRRPRVAGRKHGVLPNLQARLSRRRKISSPGAG